jgi:hypothetical protein
VLTFLKALKIKVWHQIVLLDEYCQYAKFISRHSKKKFITNNAFWYVTPCTMQDMYQRVGGMWSHVYITTWHPNPEGCVLNTIMRISKLNTSIAGMSGSMTYKCFIHQNDKKRGVKDESF